MRWAYIEALEERTLLSAVAPADDDQRLLVDVDLMTSVQAGPLIHTAGAVKDVLFDSQRNELFVLEQDRVERFKADDWTKLEPLAMGSMALAADLSPDGHFLYVLNSESVSKIDLDSGESRTVAIRRAFNPRLFDLAVTLDGVILSEADPNSPPGQACNTLSRISLEDDLVERLTLDGSRECFDYAFMLARSADFGYVSMINTSDDYAIDHGIISGRTSFPGAFTTAVSRDGSFRALAGENIVVENKSFEAVAHLPVIWALVAFDPSRDVMLAASQRDMRLHAYDTTTWNELYSLELPDVLGRFDGWGNGSMSISADGASMFMAVDWGVRVFDLTGSNAFYGAGVTLTADVGSRDGVGVYGGVDFIDQATQSSVGVAVLSNGRATLAVNSLSAGTHSIIAQYQGNDLFQPAESLPTSLVVHKAQTSINLSFPNPDAASVTVAANTATPAGGTITLWEQDQLIKTIELSDAMAPIPLSLSPGWHTLIARYSGTSNFEGSVSTETAVLVPDESATTVVQSSTITPYGKAMTFSATVTRLPSLDGSESGLVVLYDGETPLTQGNVDFGGHVSFTIDQLGVGVHNIYAKFLGTLSLRPSTSDPISHTVEKATTTITISAPAVSDWSHATVLAKVTSNSGVPLNVGFVEIYSNGLRTNVAAVQNGQATLLANVPGGNHTITAKYVGTENISGSTSNAVNMRILVGQSSVTLTPSRNWQIKGNPITWTATVNVVRQAGLPRSGFVRFNDGKRILASVPVDIDTATFTTSSLAAGDHTITATYVPDSASWTGSSGSAKLTIAAATTVDLMVMYTDAAMKEEGGQAQILTIIDRAVDGTNEAFLNSHIPVKMRLVHKESIAYHESGRFARDLNRLALPHDGYMDQVHALRKNYRADLVSLLVSDGDLGGIGFELTDVHDRTNANFGFSVVWSAQAAGPKYALAHELGHNFGASHDVEHSDGLGATTFSHGYRFRVGRPLYHDIMSYDPGQTIPYFSNPRIKYNGVPTGTADSADAARTITMTAPFVAKYL